MIRSSLIAVAATALLVAGCSEKPAARYASTQGTGSDATPQGTFASVPVPVRQDTATPTSSSVHIEERILKACGDIPTAHFAFDSARVQPDAASGLDALARCFSTGPLRGKSMRLIGHTDPRGEVEYNLGLGQRRAGSVAGYLGSRRVGAAQLTASSRGQFDATGVDEEGWARARRVDVLLAD